MICFWCEPKYLCFMILCLSITFKLLRLKPQLQDSTSVFLYHFFTAQKKACKFWVRLFNIMSSRMGLRQLFFKQGGLQGIWTILKLQVENNINSWHKLTNKIILFMPASLYFSPWLTQQGFLFTVLSIDYIQWQRECNCWYWMTCNRLHEHNEDQDWTAAGS